jgi:hypothetical protein
MTISVQVTSQKIVASAAAGGISATVSPQPTANIAVGGGVGPQGVQGIPGDSLSAASDVQLNNVAAGDLLRYGNGGKWQNFPESNLVIDGQNF